MVEMVQLHIMESKEGEAFHELVHKHDYGWALRHIYRGHEGLFRKLMYEIRWLNKSNQVNCSTLVIPTESYIQYSIGWVDLVLVISKKTPIH